MKNETGSNIRIEYDTAYKLYYIVWHPMPVVSAGSTREEALADLKEAAHSGIDTIINAEMEKAG